MPLPQGCEKAFNEPFVIRKESPDEEKGAGEGGEQKKKGTDKQLEKHVTKIHLLCPPSFALS